MSTLAPLRLVFEAMEPSDEEAWEIVGRMSGMANPTGFARSVIRGDTWTVPDLKRRLFLAISNTAPNARSDAYRSPFYHSVLQHFKARLKATDWWLTRPGLTPE